MLMMFSAVILMLFRLPSVLFRVVAGVWKYFLSLPRSCNIKLKLSAIMTGKKGTNTTYLEDSLSLFLFFCTIVLYCWETGHVDMMLILGANAVTLVWSGFYVAYLVAFGNCALSLSVK